MPKIMIVAGEASGDLHGSNLVEAARSLNPDLDFYGLGGEKLEQAGVELLFDLEHQQLVGLTEILSSLTQVLATLRTLKKSIVTEKPEALVLIDYPDFNLSLAKTARKAGVPVFYYISPQLWAWRQGRIKKIKKLVTRMAVVFPFEVEFYRRQGMEVFFVGHPLLDVMKPVRPKPDVKRELGFNPNDPLLTLLPGSRMTEVRQLLPLMLQAVSLVKNKNPRLSVAVSQADTISSDEIKSYLPERLPGIRLFSGQTHKLQNAADVVLTASGTATLETAISLTPMLVVYRLKPLTFFIIRRLLKVEHVALPNLIAGRALVPELLQKEAYPDRIACELENILCDSNKADEIIAGLRQVREELGAPGASRRAAELLLEMINGKHKNG